MLAPHDAMPTAPHPSQRLSYADLAHLPEDGSRHELYHGSLLTIPAPPAGHDTAALAVLDRLHQYTRQHGGRAVGAPFDLILSPHDVIQPDVAFYHASRCALIFDGPPFRHPPDLVAEVLSRATAAVDRGPKPLMLSRYGVLEYWIVDAGTKTIDVLVLRDGRYELFGRTTGKDQVWSTILIDLELTANAVFL